MSITYNREEGEILEQVVAELCKAIRGQNIVDVDKFLRDSLEHHEKIRLGPPKRSDTPSKSEELLKKFLGES